MLACLNPAAGWSPAPAGWITDSYFWRWIFYINLPFGILAVLMAKWLVEDPPYIQRKRGAGIDLVGISLLAVPSFQLSRLNLQIAEIDVIISSILNGIAISFIFVPLTTITMSQLGQAQIGNASGLYNLMRNLGGSLGIAFVTTMLARGAQTHQALMVGHLSPYDPAFVQRMAAAQTVLGLHADPVTAKEQAYAAVYSLLDQQAHLWAFMDNFYIFGLLALAAIPLVVLFKRVSIPQKAVETVH